MVTKGGIAKDGQLVYYNCTQYKHQLFFSTTGSHFSVHTRGRIVIFIVQNGNEIESRYQGAGGRRRSMTKYINKLLYKFISLQQ